VWDLAEILKILDREIKARENCMVPGDNKEHEASSKYVDFSTENYTGSSLFSGASKKLTEPRLNRCVSCYDSHWSDKCKIISEIGLRKEYLKINQLCFICLRKGHLSKNFRRAKSYYFCKSSQHNSAICDRKKDESSTNCVSEFSTILLQTAILCIVNPKNNKTMKVKVLFDQGSQRSYVSKKVKDQLMLNVIGKEHLSINTFGNSKTKSSVLEKVSFRLNNNKKESFDMQALCNDVICLPFRNDFLNVKRADFSHLEGIEFADSGESKDDIDLLIGSDFYWSFVTGKVRIGKVGEPVAIETQFGWVLNGPENFFPI